MFVVSYGAIQALAGVVGRHLQPRAPTRCRAVQIWLRFATWILLGLEFALAADLVRTAVAPTWDDITKLAVIATIRTMLNYFLAKDIAEFDQARNSSRKSALHLAFGRYNSPLLFRWTPRQEYGSVQGIIVAQAQGDACAIRRFRGLRTPRPVKRPSRGNASAAEFSCSRAGQSPLFGPEG